jgi:hypothetical protein
VKEESRSLLNWTAQLASDGFVCLPDFCDDAFVTNILGVSRQRIREVMAALGDREIGIGSAAGYHEIVQRSPLRWDLPVSPAKFGTSATQLPWWPLVASVLGDDAEHSFSGIVYSDPGSPAQYWHIDSPHIDAAHLDPHALNVLIALQDIPMEMGPTEIAVASHVLTNHHGNRALVQDKLVYQHAGTAPELLVEGTRDPVPETWSSALTSGSCLVFDDRILHRGLANNSSQRRYVAYFSYRRKGYLDNTHFESQRSLLDGAG